MAEEEQRGPREIAASLKREVLAEKANSHKQNRNNRWLWLASSAGVVIGSAGATISGFSGAAAIAGAFGVVAVLSTGAERKFNPDVKRRFHDQQAADASALANDIDIGLLANADPSHGELLAWNERLRVLRSRPIL
jgi:uncharacterized membrane-anchored protein